MLPNGKSMKNTYLSTRNFRSQIESITQHSYHALIQDNQIIKGKIRTQFPSPEHENSFRRFDAFGNIIELEYFREAGSFLPSSKHLYENKYSKDDDLIEYSTGTNFKVKIEYDKMKNKIYEATIDEFRGQILTSWKRDFDRYGNPIEVKYYTKETLQSTTRYEYTYNDNKQIQKKIVTEIEREGEHKYIHTFEYDANGNISLHTEYDSELKFDHSISFTYDQYNNVGTTSISNIQNILSHTYLNEYKYDNRQNWIQRINYFQENPKFITERIFKYY